MNETRTGNGPGQGMGPRLGMGTGQLMGPRQVMGPGERTEPGHEMKPGKKQGVEIIIVNDISRFRTKNPTFPLFLEEVIKDQATLLLNNPIMVLHHQISSSGLLGNIFTIQGTVHGISSLFHSTEWHVQFTTLPLKNWSDQE